MLASDQEVEKVWNAWQRPADKNGDGKMTKKEFKDYQVEIAKLKADKVIKRWGKWDSNADGVIDRGDVGRWLDKHNFKVQKSDKIVKHTK